LQEQWFLGELAWNQFLALGDVADHVFSIPAKNVSTEKTPPRFPLNLPSDRLIGRKMRANKMAAAQLTGCFAAYRSDGTN
jgi:hypothetical protein